MKPTVLALFFVFVAACGGSSSPNDGGGDPASADGAIASTGDASIAPSCTVGAATTPLTIASTRGLLQGVTAGSTTAFLGVPYAAPPVGTLRFAPTEQHACWTDLRKADAYGAICPQTDLTTSSVAGDEDCLFLNVWTPSLSSSAKLPVLFWIHGGANILGSADQQVTSVSSNLYDGEALATRENVVVVSINYRLGALGFLSHPALSAESAHGSSGNYALLDAVAALSWVRDNVGQLGGDPSRVTIFGESAGAVATCTLLASPLAHGLFSAAMMESGDCSALPSAQASTSGQAFATKLGCADADCLRQLSVSDILGASSTTQLPLALSSYDFSHGISGSVPFAANVDGWALPEDPLWSLKDGSSNQVPLVVGSNAQEMALFLIASTTYTCGQYEQDIASAFGAQASTVLGTYPCTFDGHAAEVAALTDLVMTCPARRIARAVASTSQPVYRYHFTHANSWALAYGAYHTAELPYVFDSFGAVAAIPTVFEMTLSDEIQDRWGAFATTHVPSAMNADAWPAYSTAGQQWELLDTPSSHADDSTSANCDMWTQVMGW